MGERTAHSGVWGGGVTRGHISWENEERVYHSGDPDQGCLTHNRGQEMYSDGRFLFFIGMGFIRSVY